MFDEPLRAITMFGIGVLLGIIVPRIYRKAKKWFDKKMSWF